MRLWVPCGSMYALHAALLRAVEREGGRTGGAQLLYVLRCLAGADAVFVEINRDPYTEDPITTAR